MIHDVSLKSYILSLPTPNDSLVCQVHKSHQKDYCLHEDDRHRHHHDHLLNTSPCVFFQEYLALKRRPETEAINFGSSPAQPLFLPSFSLHTTQTYYTPVRKSFIILPPTSLVSSSKSYHHERQPFLY